MEDVGTILAEALATMDIAEYVAWGLATIVYTTIGVVLVNRWSEQVARWSIQDTGDGEPWGYGKAGLFIIVAVMVAYLLALVAWPVVLAMLFAIRLGRKIANADTGH